MSESFEEHFDRAKRALAEGWADQALVPATEAVKLAPERADARVVLARAWLGNGGWARAISDARAALDLKPEPSVVAAAHDVIGRASLRIGAAADAESALREVRRLAPRPQASALLVGVLAEAGSTVEAIALAREDAARAGEDWETSRLAFESLVVALGTASAAETGVRLQLADLFYDVGLLDDAKARYQAVLAKEPASERAADGFRALAAGEKKRPRAARATPAPASGGSGSVRMIRLVVSGLGGAVVIFTLARWQALAIYGPLRPALVVAGFAVVIVCVVLARRDELAAARAAEIAAAGKTSP